MKTYFPISLFISYVAFYAGQAIYNTYLNLYLHQVGFSQSQIGFVVSISTFFVLGAQLFWGVRSDRAKSKNTILEILFTFSTVLLLIFYISTQYLFIVGVILLLALFFVPIPTLQDNLALEHLEKTKWDFGTVRVGGTLGYAFTILVIGFVLKENYRSIFLMTAFFTGIAGIAFYFAPSVKGYKKEKKHDYKKILQNKKMNLFIGFNVIFMITISYYYSYYPIYFSSIGGDSKYIGFMMFACAIIEVPCLFKANKVVKKWGIEKVLIFSGIITALRWFALYKLTNPILIILVNLLHGIGYTGFSYSLLTFINQNVPQELKATGQTFNALMVTVFSKIIFGFIGGYLSDYLGVDKVMLGAGILMLSMTAIFYLGIKGMTEKSSTRWRV